MTEPDDEGFDTRAAAALIRSTTENTRRSLDVRVPQLYAGWGVAWLVGLGAMWLSVRNQVHYSGPSAASAILLGVLLVAAVILTIYSIIRATRGIQGQSARQGTMFGFAWPIGFALCYALEGGLAHAGASGTVLGLVGAAGPLLVTSLIYLVGSAIWLDMAMFTMGAWLAVVAAVGVWTGPVTVLLVNAVAGGGGFLVMAGYLLWRRR
jgi:hypothetical protein